MDKWKRSMIVMNVIHRKFSCPVISVKIKVPLRGYWLLAGCSLGLHREMHYDMRKCDGI